MKHLILIAAFAVINCSVNAQTNGRVTGSGQNSGTGGAGKANTGSTKVTGKGQKKLPPGTAIHGGKPVPKSHGAHDYTPGSPIGTGGAGGGSLSGSPQGSASENAIGKNPSDELLKKNNGIQNNQDQQNNNPGAKQNHRRSRNQGNVRSNSTNKVLKGQNK
ncbi:MAG: hypothetical protein ACR2KZ_11675, partial [Segetibacter sp.]